MGKQRLSARAQRNVDWIHQYLRVPEGRLVGQRVQLSPAQIEWMEMIYGSPTRTFLCSLPRKNGKTSWAAMILLLHLSGPEAKRNGQLFSCAQSRDQAAILFAAAAKMVRMSPELSEYVQIKDSAKQLVCPELGTVYKALSADASTALGLSPTMVVHDELGAVRGPRFDLYEALETAAAAQEEPLSIVISTQAPNAQDLLSILLEDAKSGADQRVKYVLYAVPEDGDPFDREQLAKAQPNWHLMNHDEVFRQAEEARRMPSREAAFRNLVANQQVELINPFITKGVWLANSHDPDQAVFYEEPVYVGLDLSARNDLTAMVMVAFRERWHVKCVVWTPEKGLRERAKNDRAPYDVWAKDGYIRPLPGASIDYGMLAVEIAEALEDCKVACVAFDRWRMDLLKTEFDKRGIKLPLEPFGQGFQSMAPALDTLESVLLNEKMAHGNNPVLTMCMNNSRVESDAAGNRKLNKKKATGRIDAAVALAMAMGVTPREAGSTGVSVYESCGVGI